MTLVAKIRPEMKLSVSKRRAFTIRLFGKFSLLLIEHLRKCNWGSLDCFKSRVGSNQGHGKKKSIYPPTHQRRTQPSGTTRMKLHHGYVSDWLRCARYYLLLSTRLQCKCTQVINLHSLHAFSNHFTTYP